MSRQHTLIRGQTIPGGQRASCPPKHSQEAAGKIPGISSLVHHSASGTDAFRGGFRWLSAVLFGVLFSFSLFASPRQPMPPWPENTLAQWSFDEPYSFASGVSRKGDTVASVDPAWGAESWSGYALNRAGRQVTPLRLPVLAPNGSLQIPGGTGTIRFWFRPNWSSGQGPGHAARLLELSSGDGKTGVCWWALEAEASGRVLTLSRQTGDGLMLAAQTDIAWQAGEWRLIAVAFTPENTVLYVDGIPAAEGVGLPAVPEKVLSATFLTVGSDAEGRSAADGQFECLTTFAETTTAWKQSAYYRALRRTALLGPVGTAEEELVKVQTVSLMESMSPPGEPGEEEDPGVPVYPATTNGFRLLPPVWTNGAVIITLAGGESNGVYDVFGTAELNPTNAWECLERGAAGQTNFTFTDLSTNRGFFILGTMLDSDGDGLTDAWETLVSKTNPTDADSDDDNLPDGWEWNHFGDFQQGASGDYDGDGSSNLQEYQNATDPNTLVFSISLGTKNFNSTQAFGQFVILGGVPSYAAVLVNGTNLHTAVWMPYTGMTSFPLGSTDGVYEVRFGLKGRSATATPAWIGTTVVLDRVPPQIIITNPTMTNLSKPVIQVQGFIPDELLRVTYAISNAAGFQTNLTALLTGAGAGITNTFQCFDVDLTDGANRLTLTATDLAGNVAVTNLTFTLNYAGDTNPPVIEIHWPQNNARLGMGHFSLRGNLDDETALVFGRIVDAAGQTNVFEGLVERNGNFWLENLPLSSGTNTLTITAIDAANNMSMTNLCLVKSDVTITIGDISPEQLNQPTVTVNGTISAGGYVVWINGVVATMNGDGTWMAENVPVSSGGTAVFAVAAIPASDNGGNGTPPAHPQADPGTWNPTSPDVVSAALQEDKPAVVELVRGKWHYLVRDVEWSCGYYQRFDWKWSEEEGGHVTKQAGDQAGECPLPFYRAGKHCRIETNGITSGEEWNTEGTNSLATPIDYASWFWSGWELNGPMASGELAWEEYYSDSFNIHAGQSAQNVKVVLRTGGKSASKRKNLFTLYGSAIEMIARNRSFHIIGQNISPVAIQVVGPGQLLGTDGRLYVTLPDNEKIDVTLKTSAPYFLFAVSATKHRMKIKANDTDLESNCLNTNAEFCAGEKIIFTTTFVPPVEGIQTQSNQWILPPNYKNAWEEYVPPTLGEAGDYFITTCYPRNTYYSRGGPGTICLPNPPFCKKYIITEWPLKEIGTGAWWISCGIKLTSCYASILFSNSQTVNLVDRGQFLITRPTIVSNEWSCGGVNIFTNADGSLNELALAQNGAGMDWTIFAKRPDNISGLGWYTQLIRRTISYNTYPWPGLPYLDTTDGNFWLDSYEPYKAPMPFTLDRPNVRGVFFSDSPGLIKNLVSFYDHAEVHDDFKTYFRFMPSGLDNIPITISRIDWGWHGKVLKTNGVWSLVTSNWYGPVFNLDDDTFPEWDTVYHNY